MSDEPVPAPSDPETPPVPTPADVARVLARLATPTPAPEPAPEVETPTTASKMEELPSWAQDLIRSLRSEASEQRVRGKTERAAAYEAEIVGLQEQIDKLTLDITERAVVDARRSALTEAGLPEAFLSLLHGSEAEQISREITAITAAVQATNTAPRFAGALSGASSPEMETTTPGMSTLRAAYAQNERK